MGKEDGQACIATDWKEEKEENSPAIEAFGLVSLFAQTSHRLNHILNIKREDIILKTGVIYGRASFLHIPSIGDRIMCQTSASLKSKRHCQEINDYTNIIAS